MDNTADKKEDAGVRVQDIIVNLLKRLVMLFMIIP